MMANINRIPIPQDQRVTLSNGMMNPAWYRFFVALASEAGVASLDSRVGSLERNFLKGPLSDVNAAALVVGTSFDQAEIVAIANRVIQAVGAINAIIDRLESSNIVRTE